MKQSLRDFSRALHDSADDVPIPAELTRARVMSSLHSKRRRRFTRAGLLVPLAAVFVGSTAWAAATDRLPEVWKAVVEFASPRVALQPQAAPPKVAPKPAPRQMPVSRAETSSEPVAPTAAPEAAIAEQQLPAAAPAVPRSELQAPGAVAPRSAVQHENTVASRSAVQHKVAAPAAIANRVDPADDLYRTAHRLHFAERDNTRALSAWDRYLAEAPDGRFALEARYNRALCLVRLGRTAEGRSALAEFAAGKFGGYRSKEAAELIGALDATGR